jgi:hypothetical protein
MVATSITSSIVTGGVGLSEEVPFDKIKFPFLSKKK